jgi:zinc transporter 1/2/3
MMHRHIHREKVNEFGCCKCNITPFILMIALSVHAVFEGIAVGIEAKSSVVYNLIMGIVIHKSAASVSLGISLSKSFPGNIRIPLTMAIGFAVASPTGIIIGILLRSASPMVDVVFSSIAGGTFVYIACSEVIVEEFALPGHRFTKYFAMLCGALVITGLWFLD